MSVDPGVSVLSHPNHPARLAALFLATAAACALVLSAAVAVTYVFQEERISDVAGVSTDNSIEAPDGLIIVTPVDDAAAFEDLTGFAPILPAQLPDAVDPAPFYSVTQPDEFDTRDGRIVFAAKDGFSVEGVYGPTLVLIEARGEPGEGVDAALKRLTSGNGRTIVATFQCGDLVIEAQMYFNPAPDAGEEFVTPYMRETARQFLDGMLAQCA